MRKFGFVEWIKEALKDETEEKKIYVSLPERSTKKSAGYDFYVPVDTVCKSHEITMVKTGIKAYMEDDETLLLFNRSSNPKKRGLILINGVGVVDRRLCGQP